MERLTKIGNKNQVLLTGTSCSYGYLSYDCKLEEGRKLLKAALDKLAKYENLEEQGRFLELPCKVGDTVWNYSYFGLKKYKVKYIGFDKNGLLYFDCNNGITYGFRCYLQDFKDKVFATKSEAEAKLKGLINEE